MNTLLSIFTYNNILANKWVCIQLLTRKTHPPTAPLCFIVRRTFLTVEVQVYVLDNMRVQKSRAVMT